VHNLKREMANVTTEPPESAKRRFNEAPTKAAETDATARRKRVKKGPEIIRMLNELPVVYIRRSSNGRQLPAERK
jgi:hypothetical protein